jgi:hypothetical protein
MTSGHCRCYCRVLVQLVSATAWSSKRRSTAAVFDACVKACNGNTADKQPVLLAHVRTDPDRNVCSNNRTGAHSDSDRALLQMVTNGALRHCGKARMACHVWVW